jgi:hypothetical protein
MKTIKINLNDSNLNELLSLPLSSPHLNSPKVRSLQIGLIPVQDSCPNKKEIPEQMME